MKEQLPPIPPEGAVVIETGVQAAPAGSRSLATRDGDVIRIWAERHSAEPALEDTLDASNVRFNFPGVHRYTPIDWNQWLAVFNQKRLIFVYEEDIADRAYQLWQSRRAEPGDDRQDWFEAERQLHAEGAHTGGGYGFVRKT